MEQKWNNCLKWKFHSKNETKNETKNKIVARREWNRLNFILAGRNWNEMEWNKNYFILHSNEWNILNEAVAVNEWNSMNYFKWNCCCIEWKKISFIHSSRMSFSMEAAINASMKLAATSLCIMYEAGWSLYMMAIFKLPPTCSWAGNHEVVGIQLPTLPYICTKIERREVFKHFEKKNNFDTSNLIPQQISRTRNCSWSYPSLGVAYLCVHCHPQHKCPNWWFLDPTVQSLRKALVSHRFVVNKELQK